MKTRSLLFFVMLTLPYAARCQANKATPPDQKPLTLNGKFKNYNTTYQCHLWNWLRNDYGSQDTCSACYVKLRVVDKHTVQASLMLGDSTLKTAELDGRVKEHESILVKSHFKIEPKWIVVWLWHLGKYEMRISDKGNLIVTDNQGGFVALIAMPLGAGDRDTGCDFERIENL